MIDALRRDGVARGVRRQRRELDARAKRCAKSWATSLDG